MNTMQTMGTFFKFTTNSGQDTAFSGSIIGFEIKTCLHDVYIFSTGKYLYLIALFTFAVLLFLFLKKGLVIMETVSLVLTQEEVDRVNESTINEVLSTTDSHVFLRRVITPEDNLSLGGKLKKRMEMLGVSLRNLSQTSGVCLPTLSALVNGKPVRIENLVAVAIILGVPAEAHESPEAAVDYWVHEAFKCDEGKVDIEEIVNTAHVHEISIRAESIEERARRVMLLMVREFYEKKL